MSDKSHPRRAAGARDSAPGSPSILRDALEPAARQMGRVLETMGRAANLALTPIHVFVWSFDVVAESMAKPMATRMRKGMGALGEMMEDLDAGTFTETAGKMIEVVSPAFFTRKPASADLAYDPQIETRELGTDEATLKVTSSEARPAYQFNFRVSKPETCILQTSGSKDLVMGLFRAEPPYRRITYKDDGGEGRNPLIRRRLDPGSYFVVVKSFGEDRFEADFELSVALEPEEQEEDKN